MYEHVTTIPANWPDEREPDAEVWTDEQIVNYIVYRRIIGFAPTQVAKDLNEFGQRDAKGRKWIKARVEDVWEGKQYLAAEQLAREKARQGPTKDVLSAPDIEWYWKRLLPNQPDDDDA